MINDRFLDRTITRTLLEQQEVHKSSHISSGKLSASILGHPLQWQMLKIIGIPEKPFDEYVLRKFKRGNDVEEWIVNHLEKIGLVSKQVFLEYENCIGYADALVNMHTWESKLGIIPHEIKSVTNAKFKNILLSRQADPQHRLQATLYALALGASFYAIDYVASDDYRIETMIYSTSDTAEEVRRIIQEFNRAMTLRKVPVFQPRYTWQDNVQYNNFPDWMKLQEWEVEEKLQKEYPELYAKFIIGDGRIMEKLEETTEAIKEI